MTPTGRGLMDAALVRLTVGATATGIGLILWEMGFGLLMFAAGLGLVTFSVLLGVASAVVLDG